MVHCGTSTAFKIQHSPFIIASSPLQRGEAAWYAVRVTDFAAWRDARGSVNWTALIALAAVVAALAAVATALAVFRQAREDGSNSRFALGVESLWRLEQMWDAPDRLDTRQQAAASLLDGHPTDDVGAVLDFFDMLALLVQRQILDREMVWHEFYWPMACYWRASQDYITTVHAREPHSWEDAGRVVTELQAIEARKSAKALAEVPPTSSDVTDFLHAERGLEDDTADTDVPRMPL